MMPVCLCASFLPACCKSVSSVPLQDNVPRAHTAGQHTAGCSSEKALPLLGGLLSTTFTITANSLNTQHTRHVRAQPPGATLPFHDLCVHPARNKEKANPPTRLVSGTRSSFILRLVQSLASSSSAIS